MKQDLKLSRTAEKPYFDLSVSGGQFDTVEGFESAIITSLFTDGRAVNANVKEPSKRRGHISDILTLVNSRLIGSTLWTYEQSRLTENIINSINSAAEESLQWLVDDNLAFSVSASARILSVREIAIDVIIVTNGGETKNYSVKWKATGNVN